MPEVLLDPRHLLRYRTLRSLPRLPCQSTKFNQRSHWTFERDRKRARAVLADAGFKSVAGPGFEAPGVIVSYTDDPNIQNGSRFAAAGLQIAAGVPLHCDEPADFRTFRLGLFGLDKLNNIDRTVANLEKGLAAIKD